VLAKAIRRHRVTQRPEIEHFAEGVLDHLYHGDADAGLAALRAEGWAVVRTADVEESAEAVEDYARMLLSGTAFDWHWALAQRLKEAIR